MTKLRNAACSFATGMLMLVGCHVSPALAAKLENTFYAASTTLFFRVSDAALGKLLPAGWELAPVPQMQGGNLTVTFSDILASETADGQPGDTARAVWLSAPVQKTGTGERAGAVLGGFASDPSFAPGPYGNYALAEAHLDRRRQVEANGASINEDWQFAGNDGARVELRLTFADGPAQHLKPPQSNVLSATKPNLRRINKTEVVVREMRPDDSNTVKEVNFAASGPLLSPLFDGSQQLIAIISAPWLTTQVLVP
jgi:hypothetical protein